MSLPPNHNGGVFAASRQDDPERAFRRERSGSPFRGATRSCIRSGAPRSGSSWSWPSPRTVCADRRSEGRTSGYPRCKGDFGQGAIGGAVPGKASRWISCLRATSERLPPPRPPRPPPPRTPPPLSHASTSKAASSEPAAAPMRGRLRGKAGFDSSRMSLTSRVPPLRRSSTTLRL
jgi:hypothetical protein